MTYTRRQTKNGHTYLYRAGTYRDKDTVEKAFSHLKPHLEPFFSRSENGILPSASMSMT